MAKYKISNDYSFFTKNNDVLRNELNPDRTVKKYVVIDDTEHNIKGQEGRLELIEEKRIIAPILPKPEIPEKKEESKPKEKEDAESASNTERIKSDDKQESGAAKEGTEKEDESKGRTV